ARRPPTTPPSTEDWRERRAVGAPVGTAAYISIARALRGAKGVLIAHKGSPTSLGAAIVATNLFRRRAKGYARALPRNHDPFETSTHRDRRQGRQRSLANGDTLRERRLCERPVGAPGARRARTE